MGGTLGRSLASLSIGLILLVVSNLAGPAEAGRSTGGESALPTTGSIDSTAAFRPVSLISKVEGAEGGYRVPKAVRPEPTTDQITVLFTGDTIIHLTVTAAAARRGDPYDYSALFDPVSHIISSADLALCHLEVPLSPTSSNLSSYPLFNSPREVAEGLAAAGYDGCSTASNHAFDQGVAGVEGTIQVLTEAGLRHSGTADRVERGWQATMYDVEGVQIAHISATYWLNGLRMPEGSPWLVQLLDPREVSKVAFRARSSGADLVVVSIHCCVEYATIPPSAQVELARDLVGSPDIDLIVTHHSHVVGPVERHGGEFILHGLGNFISGQFFDPRLSDGVIAVATARNDDGTWRFTEVEVVPIQVQRWTHEVHPADRDSASYRRTMSAINAWGAGIGEYNPYTPTLEELDLVR